MVEHNPEKALEFWPLWLRYQVSINIISSVPGKKISHLLSFLRSIEIAFVKLLREQDKRPKTCCVAVNFVRFLFSPTSGALSLEPFALAPSAAPAEAPLTKSHPPPPGVPVSTLNTKTALKRNFPPPPPRRASIHQWWTFQLFPVDGRKTFSGKKCPVKRNTFRG